MAAGGAASLRQSLVPRPSWDHLPLLVEALERSNTSRAPFSVPMSTRFAAATARRQLLFPSRSPPAPLTMKDDCCDCILSENRGWDES